MGKASLPASIVKERRDYTIKMKLAGLSSATITRQLNADSKSKGWLMVTQNTVEKDIAAYFRKNRVLKTEDFDHLEQMREALLAQMEINMEKLSIHIASKAKGNILYDKAGKPVQVNTWKAFELADALEKLHKMQMDFAELQNWNRGKQNITLNFQQNNINAMFEMAEPELKKVPKTVKKEFLADLLILQDKLKAEEEERAQEDLESSAIESM